MECDSEIYRRAHNLHSLTNTALSNTLVSDVLLPQWSVRLLLGSFLSLIPLLSFSNSKDSWSVLLTCDDTTMNETYENTIAKYISISLPWALSMFIILVAPLRSARTGPTMATT